MLEPTWLRYSVYEWSFTIYDCIPQSLRKTRVFCFYGRFIPLIATRQHAHRGEKQFETFKTQLSNSIEWHALNYPSVPISSAPSIPLSLSSWIQNGVFLCYFRNVKSAISCSAKRLLENSKFIHFSSSIPSINYPRSPPYSSTEKQLLVYVTKSFALPNTLKQQHLFSGRFWNERSSNPVPPCRHPPPPPPALPTPPVPPQPLAQSLTVKLAAPEMAVSTICSDYN